MFCQLSCTFARLETRKAKHAINVGERGCSKRCQLLICTTSCYTVCHLFGKIHQNKAPAPLLTSRNEGNVLSVPPLETHGMVLRVICHCWQVFYAALSGPISVRLLLCAKAFQAPFDEILSVQWPRKRVP